jgi:hypothetical protein
MLSLFLTFLFLMDDEPLRGWREVGVTVIAENLHHVQGIDVEGDVFWVSSVDAKAGKGYLTRLDRKTGKLLRQVEVQSGKRIHPGGISLDGDSIWIPVAEYDRDGPTTMERRNKNTLEIETSFEVNDHIGCVAVGRDFLIGGSWSSRTVYQWTKEGKELLRKENPIATAWQDLKMDGELLMGSGPAGKEQGAVEWLKLPGFELVKRIVTHQTDRKLSYSHEGMTYRKGSLYFLPEDAPSRLFEFRR